MGHFAHLVDFFILNLHLSIGVVPVLFSILWHVKVLKRYVLSVDYGIFDASHCCFLHIGSHSFLAIESFLQASLARKSLLFLYYITYYYVCKERGFLSRNTKAGTTERSRFCRLYTFCHLPHTRCSRSPMTILQQMGEHFNRSFEILSFCGGGAGGAGCAAAGAAGGDLGCGKDFR